MLLVFVHMCICSNIKLAGLFVLVLMCRYLFVMCMQRRVPIYYVCVLFVLCFVCILSNVSGTAVVLGQSSVITLGDEVNW